MTASRAGVPPGEGATIGIEFAADALDAPTPRWQRDEELGQQLVPAFVAGALFILVVAAGVVWMVRLKFPRWRVPPDAGAGTAVEGVTPAMHLAIARGRCRGDRAEARAAIDGLAAAGILRVDGDRIELSGTRTTGVSHEQILVEALARCGRAGARRGALESWRLRRRLRRALAADLVAGGWAATERVQAARDLTRAGVVVIVFGLGTWVAASIGLRQYGAWPLAVPCSLVISGLILAAAGQRFEILSATGAAARVLYFARVLDGRTKA